MKNSYEIVVIGAGLTGLTTAYYLKKRNKDFIVLEKNTKHGGVIQTKNEMGFTYEEGPNTGVMGNPDVAELFEDLTGLCTCELTGKNVNKRYIFKNGIWEQMPMGPISAIKTPLFTMQDKFRILGEPFRKRGTNPEESLSDLVLRRMGRSFLDYAIDPFILGVYSGDPSKLITKYAFPKLYNLEQNYGSFIGGSIKKMFENKDKREKKATRQVFSVYGGLSNMTDALYTGAGEDRFMLGIGDIEIHKKEGHYLVTGVYNNEKVCIKAQKVITTTAANTLRSLLPSADIGLISAMEKVNYARVIQTVIGFNEWKGIELDGFGGLVPFKENRDILGVLFLSAILSNRAPAGGALFSVFAGGVRREDIFEKTDQELENIIEKEFSDVMEVKEFKPDLLRIIRYKHAIPQYGMESQEKNEAIESLQSYNKGLLIGGNLRDGIGMADRIKQGKHLAEIV